MSQSSDTRAASWATRLEALHQSTLAIVEMTDATAIGQGMLDVLEALLPYERAAIVLVDDADGTLRLIAHGTKGLGDEEYGENFRRISELIQQSPSGVIRRVVETGEARNVADVRLDASYLMGAGSVRSELCVPILVGHRTIGAINVESVEPDAFSDEDQTLLTLLANQVCLALEKTRLVHVVGRETVSKAEAQADASASRKLLASAVESLVDGFALFDAERRLRLCNQRFRSFYPRLSDLIQPGIHADALSHAAVARSQFAGPADTDDAVQLIEAAPPPAGRQRIFETAEGRWIEARESPVDQGGQICLHIDISERRRLEHLLAQSHKLEAVGRLTAGVAHDFNNLLAVVLGNLELAQSRVNDPDTIELIAAALGATKRGAELTQGLLTFGRRSALSPSVLDANDVITRMAGLFRRTLPATISVDTSLASEAGRIAVDHAQLENALLNLAINARDAMPDGGAFTIGTENVRFDEDDCRNLGGDVAPGRYVMIAVSDTGVGMTPEVQSNAFEPFFTTKPLGEGSGLGLPMVFGFAKQSGGHVRIYSEVGHGTTIKLYFPESRRAAEGTAPSVPATPTRSAATARVLVVEDFESVRSVVVAQLVGLGYEVLDAPDAQTALAILRAGARVDLMITDIVMPGDLQGPQLAEIARAELPSLKVIYMSGYLKGAAEVAGAAWVDVPRLTKPVPRETLAAVVHRVLTGT